MKVLMISGDPGALDPNTETGKRTEEYRRVLGTLDVLLCRRNVLSFILGFFRGLKMTRQKKYDIITAQDVEHSFLAWILSRIYKIPFQMQIHTDIFSPYFVRNSVSNKLRVWLVKFLLPRADCVRAVSERIRKSIEGKEGEVHSDAPLKVRGDRGVMNLVVLPIFVDTEKIKKAPIQTDLHKKYPGRFIILMASRITREKNIGLALEAMREIITHPLTPSLTLREGEVGGGSQNPLLLVVGDGTEREALKLQITNHKLQNNVIFELHTDDLISYYKTCDLFLLTSNYEGYGRTLVEAAASGAKIVSSDVGIASEILSTEAIFKVGDKEDLKRKLILALENKLPAPHLPVLPNKEESLRLYKEGFKLCGGKKL